MLMPSRIGRFVLFVFIAMVVSCGGKNTNSVSNEMPTASNVTIEKNHQQEIQVGDVLTVDYLYEDAEGDVEGVSEIQWLRDGNIIPGETNNTFTVSLEDVGHALSFWLIPVAESGNQTGQKITSPEVNVPVIADSVVANAGADVYARVGENVVLDGSASFTTSGIIMSYVWDNGVTGARVSGVYNAEGRYTVKLTVTNSNGVSDTDTVEVFVQGVDAKPTHISLDPQANLFVGNSIQLNARLHFDDGTFSSNVDWRVNNGNAAVNETGVLTGVAQGSVVVTASSLGFSESITVEIIKTNPEVTGIIIQSVGGSTLGVNGSLQLTADLVFDSGPNQIGADVNWRIDNTSIAAITSKGVVSGVSVGIARVTASYGTVEHHFDITVTKQISGITISGPSVVTQGENAVYTATFEFTDNSTEIADVTWSVSDSGMASISAGGQLSGIEVGMVIISAQANNIIETMTVDIVSANFENIEIVTGVGLTLLSGEERQAVAVGIKNEKRTAATLLVNWESSDSSVAIVNQTGMVTGGNASGEAVITATLGSIQQSVSVTNLGAGKYVYFKRPQDWNEIRAHLWRRENSSDTNITGDWPGQEMEASFEYGGDWYRYAFLEAETNSDGEINVVFNCGSSYCQTGDLTVRLNEFGFWFDSENWLNEAPIGDSTIEGSQIQVQRGEVTIAGSDNLTTLIFPVGSLVDINSEAAPLGQKFAYWQGPGSELMVDPNNPTTTMVVGGATSYSISAIMDRLEDTHVQAREEYNNNFLCSGCHGEDGLTEFGAPARTLANINSRFSLAELTQYIEDYMPLGSPELCEGQCASGIAAMLVEDAILPPDGVCSADNLVPQDRSFRLLSTEEYNNSIRDLFGFSVDTQVNVTGAVPADVRANGYLTNADMLFTSSYAAAYISAAEQAAALVNSIYELVSCNNNDVNCFINEFAKKAYRRPLVASDIQSLMSVYEERGDKALLEAILSSPYMLMRSEAGTLINAGPNAGYYQLSDYEIATFLSYTYWASTPSEELMALADAGELHTPEQISSALQTMLSDVRAEKTFERFIDGWLHLYSPSPVDDTLLSPELKQAMREETLSFVSNMVFDGATYEELMTADFSYMNEALADHYGLDWPGGSGIQQVFYPATGPNSERRGLLGHGSILSINSAGTKTHPVKRGLYVRRSLMCQDFGAPPIGAELSPIVTPEMTVRMRFEESHLAGPNATPQEKEDKAACGFCHQHIDGIGFGFENYNHLGQWVTEEQVGNGSWVAIDSSGAIGNLNGVETVLIDGDKKQAYQGLDELAELIADSSHGKACYARQWYRYTRGVRENREDSCTLDAYGRTYKNNSNASLFQLMIDYTQTTNFSLRK